MSRQTDDVRSPWGMRMVNRMGRGLARIGIGKADLDPERIMAEVSASTGLTDFGPDDGWREGWRRHREAYATQGRLSFVGQHAMRREYLRILTQRARIAEAFRENPAIADVPIERPVFILGFPRTGTTVLHNLLGTEPAVRTPKMWELLRPAPPPPAETPPDEPRLLRVREDVKQVHRAIPDLLRMHPLDADGPDECFYVFGLAFHNRTANAQAPCDDYMQWLMGCDMRPAYRYYRRVLQVLSFHDRRPVWVLKAPTHLFNLDALLDVFPDARIVQTHRDPRQVAASCCSLYSVTRQLFTDHQDPVRLGREWLDTWAVAMDRALAVRAKVGEAPFFDVRFEDFVPDPAKAALELMQRLDIPCADGTAERMRAWLDAHRRDRHGRHTYRLETFGLDDALLAERFAGYTDRFDLRARGAS